MSEASQALRAIQAPIKEKYKSDPASALVTLSSTGTLDGSSSITCSLSSGPAIASAKRKVAGLHPAAGGPSSSSKPRSSTTADDDDDKDDGDPQISGELCSGDMLLESLVACSGVTLKAVATALGVPLAGGTVRAEGDLDFRGTLGVDRDAPVGFKEIRLGFEVRVEEGHELAEGVLERLGRLTERYCVVLQTIVRKPEVKVSLLGPGGGKWEQKA